MNGLSKVVTAAILLAISISLVSIYAEWAPGFAENATGKTVENTENQLKCSNAGLNIQNAVYDRTGNKLSFELENTGTIRFRKNIYIGVFNKTSQTGRKTITDLEVEEKRTVNINSGKVPEQIQVSTQECPGIEVEERMIEARK